MAADAFARIDGSDALGNDSMDSMDSGERRIYIPVSRETAAKARIVYAVLEGMVVSKMAVVVGECGKWSQVSWGR